MELNRNDMVKYLRNVVQMEKATFMANEAYVSASKACIKKIVKRAVLPPKK